MRTAEQETRTDVLSMMDSVKREITEANQLRVTYPDLCTDGHGVLYAYQHIGHEWRFFIASYGAKYDSAISLGGFRIVPESRAADPHFDPAREALSLGRGMEKKINWTRITHVAGPLGEQVLSRLVGGKCVLVPDEISRVGCLHDEEILSFACACMRDFEEHSGISIATGQDLGHGVMSSGVESSLEFLHEHFDGSVLADTSKPTAWGNYFCLAGILEGVQCALPDASVSLIGCGNIGLEVLRLIRDAGTHVQVLEASPERTALLLSMGIKVFAPERREEFLALPADAVVFNANGGSLDSLAAQAICQNSRVQAICGCENLLFADERLQEVLQSAGKLVCPTEFCGMLGYLTAVEEYCSRAAGCAFVIDAMWTVAEKMQAVSAKAARAAKGDPACAFSEALQHTSEA